MLRLYIGENALARDAAYRSYIDSFVKEHGQMALDVFDTDTLALNDCIDAVTTVPFLSAKRCVVLRQVSQNKDLASNIEKIVERIADSTELVIVEGILDSRLNYTKFIKKHANDLQQFDVLDGHALAQWVIVTAKQQGATLSRADAQLLIDRVGPNQLLVANELQKLLLVNPVITKELILSFVPASPQSSVFAMLDMVIQGNVAEVSRLYQEQRDQGVEPQAIMGMIAWQLYILSVVAAHKEENPDAIVKKAKISPFVVRKNLSLAKKLSKKQIIALLDVAISADYSIKTYKVKPEGGVLVLLLELTKQIKTA